MLLWTAFGLYCLLAVMMTAALIKEAKGTDIDNDLRLSLYVLLAITAAGWPVSLACVAVIRLGRRMAQNKAK